MREGVDVIADGLLRVLQQGRLAKDADDGGHTTCEIPMKK